MQWLKLGVVEIESAKKIISENFDRKVEREEAFSLYLSKPYQVIHDSPTIKNYTDWNSYESLNLPKISLQRINRIEEDKNNIIQIRNNDIQISKNIILDDEIHDNIISTEEHKLVALALSLSRRIIINREGEFYIDHYISDDNLYSPSHIVIDSPENSKIRVIYDLANFGNNSLASPIISLNIEKNSEVELQFINTSSDNSLLFAFIKTNIKGNLSSSMFVNGNRMGHVQFITNLEEGSVSKFTTRVLGLSENKIDVVNNVVHIGQRSVSNGIMKAISAGKAFTVVRGVATISESATNSSTSIIGRSLILGSEAKAIVAPMLEVKTGRVNMAKHSAAISKIDENQIFYLQTRGLPRKEAEGLIIRGFIIEAEDSESLINKIEEIIRSLGY